MSRKRLDKHIITTLIITLLLVLSVSCTHSDNSIKLNLEEVVETGYNFKEGNYVYWAIYEEWHNDCHRHLLYMNKETFDSLESKVEEYWKADSTDRDSLNNAHDFTLIRDSDGLHLSSDR